MAAMSGGQSLLHLGDDMQSPDVLCLLMNFLKCVNEAQNLTALKKKADFGVQESGRGHRSETKAEQLRCRSRKGQNQSTFDKLNSLCVWRQIGNSVGCFLAAAQPSFL